jgi:hypothetical protein
MSHDGSNPPAIAGQCRGLGRKSTAAALSTNAMVIDCKTRSENDRPGLIADDHAPRFPRPTIVRRADQRRRCTESFFPSIFKAWQHQTFSVDYGYSVDHMEEVTHRVLTLA